MVLHKATQLEVQHQAAAKRARVALQKAELLVLLKIALELPTLQPDAAVVSVVVELVAAVEAEDVPETSLIVEIQNGLRQLAPALMEEARAARATGDVALRIEKLAAARPRAAAASSPLAETGQWEFTSSRDPSARYLVTFGRAGHLECTCQGFVHRGNCKHVLEVRSKIFEE